MNRFDLLPTPTADGRHLVLRAVPVSPLERLRRLAARLLFRAPTRPQDRP